ncbi:MAG: inorganic diphosphatase [Clostridia bacterium]|nr:inorganic diphosphatase [Clostridia bacterium]
MIGRIVTVVVDRPLGSYHPEHTDLYYPVNYGYIEGTMAADGEEEDAYILGVNEPISRFVGRVIAVINRADDVERKWVVAPDGVSFTEKDIFRLTQFQEQYFQSTVYLPQK